MSAQPLLVEASGAVLRLKFNRPDALNALDVPMSIAFRDACRAAVAAPGLRLVVITGAGRAFMAGGDLAHLRTGGAEAVDQLIAPLHEALQILAALPVPVLGAAHGVVAGAGLGVALACDLLIAADNTRFTFAYTRIGGSPDGSTSWGLPRVIGLRKAMEMAFLGDTVDAAEALRLGLVNRLYPAAEFEAEVAKVAERLASGPTLAFARSKALLRASLERTFAEQLTAEQAAFRVGAATEDFAEGVAAFLDKRAPQFRGR